MTANIISVGHALLEKVSYDAEDAGVARHLARSLLDLGLCLGEGDVRRTPLLAMSEELNQLKVSIALGTGESNASRYRLAALRFADLACADLLMLEVSKRVQVAALVPVDGNDLATTAAAWAVRQATMDLDDGVDLGVVQELARQLEADAQELEDERHDEYDDPDQGGEG